MARPKYQIKLCYLAPDGRVVEILQTDDALGEAKTTYYLDEGERVALRKKITKGIGERMSPYYDSDGKFREN